MAQPNPNPNSNPNTNLPEERQNNSPYFLSAAFVRSMDNLGLNPITTATQAMRSGVSPFQMRDPTTNPPQPAQAGPSEPTPATANSERFTFDLGLGDSEYTRRDRERQCQERLNRVPLPTTFPTSYGRGGLGGRHGRRGGGVFDLGGRGDVYSDHAACADAVEAMNMNRTRDGLHRAPDGIDGSRRWTSMMHGGPSTTYGNDQPIYTDGPPIFPGNPPSNTGPGPNHPSNHVGGRHGPGHRGRHHRRRRSPTPSSDSSGSRSSSPHPERGAEDFNSGPPGPPPPGPPPPHFHPHEHPHPPHHHHGGRRGRRHGGPRGPPPGPPPFDVNALLANLASLPLANLASHPLANLASHPLAQSFLQGFMPATQPPTNDRGAEATTTTTADDEISFTPPLDLFTTPHAYTLHISLPGAKKEDIGVHYAANKFTLTISGIVYRPGSEEFLTTMTSSERRVGMFSREVVLKGEGGAEVDGDAITAKLEDGILIVVVPRVDKEWEDITQVEID